MKTICLAMSNWRQRHPEAVRLTVFLLAAFCGVVFARIPGAYDWELGFVATGLLQLPLLAGDVAAGNAVRQDLKISLDRDLCSSEALHHAIKAVTRAMSTHVWTLGFGVMIVAGPVFSMRSYPDLLGVFCKMLFLTLGLMGLFDTLAMVTAIRDVQEAFLKDEIPFLARDLPEMADGCEEGAKAEGDLNEQLREEGTWPPFPEDSSKKEGKHA